MVSVRSSARKDQGLQTLNEALASLAIARQHHALPLELRAAMSGARLHEACSICVLNADQ